MKRLAIITTHPIQYYAPLFKLLTERRKIQIKVFYTWGEKGNGKLFDPGFGKLRQWDVPLLDGYDYEFVNNISSRPGSHNYFGINNPDLNKTLYSWKPDALLVFGWKFKSHLKAMRHFKDRIPVLFRGDSTLLDEKKGFGFKKTLRRFSLQEVYRYINFALYVGTNNKAYFSANGLSEKQLIFAPHAIDNDRFFCNDNYYETEALKWKLELNIPTDKPGVLFAGKLEPKKNPLFLIKAANAFPGIHFIIVGNGELETIIKDKAKHLNNVTLLPFQNQSRMPVVYRLADIFVLPSKGSAETWGLAINEAMASGRMIIASNKCGGAIDLIENGKNGFVIEPDLPALFEVLKWVQQSADKIPEFKKCSKLRIQRFSLAKLSIAIEDVIINTISSKILSGVI